MFGTDKTKEQIILNLSSYQNGEPKHSFDLTKTKLLVGSFSGADIFIENPEISHYHALIILDAHGGAQIKDLASENGIYINGVKIEDGHIFSGDVLTLGSLEFHITERYSSEKLEQVDKEVKKTNIAIDTIPNELPPIDGLTLIDGEYCDINFDESSFSADSIEDIEELKLNTENYIDVDSSEERHKEIITPQEGDSVEVTILSNGTIIDLYYLPVANRTYYASGGITQRRNTITIPGLETEKKIEFLSIKDYKIEVYDIQRYFSTIDTVESDQKSWTLEKGDIQTFTYGTNQIVLKVTKTPSRLKTTPFFAPDKEFLKQGAKVFGVAITLMLLLLLVDTTPDAPEPKKVAIIYKKAVKAESFSDKKASEFPDKVNLDKGVKKENQKDDMPKFAKKQNKTKPAPAKKAVAAASKQEKVKKALKVKRYEFKSDSFKALLGSSQNIKQANIKNTNSSAIGKVASLTTSTSELSTTSVSEVGKLGKDERGSESASYGAKGLASKRGVDTAYVAPKTVVLGSMDPELLRKILREYLPQFKHCYQEELESNSENIKGVVNLDFRIGANGKVVSSNIKAKRAKFSAKGVSCMNKVLQLIQFPKPKGGGVVDVRQPLNFFSERTKF